MITPNFDNTPCKLYNQDTGELVAVGKLTNVSPEFEKVQEENSKYYAESVGHFNGADCSITIDIPRGSSKSMTQWFDWFIADIYMGEIRMKYSRHNSFDILKALEESGYGSGGRVDFYQRILLGILEQRKKYPRGRRNVHRKKYLYRNKRIRRVA